MRFTSHRTQFLALTGVCSRPCLGTIGRPKARRSPGGICRQRESTLETTFLTVRAPVSGTVTDCGEGSLVASRVPSYLKWLQAGPSPDGISSVLESALETTFWP